MVRNVSLIPTSDPWTVYFRSGAVQNSILLVYASHLLGVHVVILPHHVVLSVGCGKVLQRAASDQGHC
jgi:hypothetical protein